MKPLELAATYTIGAFLLYAFTGYKWTLALGGALALSALARHVYQTENAACNQSSPTATPGENSGE